MSSLLSLGSSGSALSVTGNGIVTHHKGKLFARSLIGVGPVEIREQNGLEGPPQIVCRPANHPLASIDNLDCNVTTDQVFQVKGADRFIIRKVIFFNHSDTPTTMVGGIYTLPSKGGREIVPAAQTYTALDAVKKCLEIDVDLGVVLRVPWLYFALTTAEGSALTMSCRVYGDVIDPLES